VTLLEGDTPLIPALRLVQHLKIDVKLYLKYEGLNPTGSFKDRGMTFAVSKALESGHRAILCASTGNTSASAAAYAAKAGMEAFVLIPQGKIARGKLCQAMMHGAKVVQIRSGFDEALKIVRKIAEDHPIVLVNSINPFRLEGQKTAAFEICDTLGDAPDYHFIPVGNAGNITAYWRGYQEYRKLKKTTRSPKMHGYEAEGAAPIVKGHPIADPQTVASAIRIGNPASWKAAETARDQSKGIIDSVTDSEILEAYRWLASLEGVFCEPASAASVAGFIKCCKKKLFRGGEAVVCTLTGHGLKDPDTAIQNSPEPITVDAELETVLKVLKL
jgi:threonine synthase